MLSETAIELIKFFTLFIWVLNGFIAGLLLLSLGVIAWLCYADEQRVRNAKRRLAARLTSSQF